MAEGRLKARMFQPGDEITWNGFPARVVSLDIGGTFTIQYPDEGRTRSGYNLNNNPIAKLVTSTADPVVEQPKAKPPLGSPPHDNPRVFDQDRQARQWDADKYTGPTDWPSLDQRIAAARAELDRPAAVMFPHVGRDDRALPVSNRRR